MKLTPLHGNAIPDFLKIRSNRIGTGLLSNELTVISTRTLV